jgi:p-hydroxybenzoate 3-monooxygenase
MDIPGGVETQVAIVGAGPAGLTLAHLLHRRGIGCVVLEARSREYVERRVRAGLLEHNTVELLHQIGVGERLDREGLTHGGVYLRWPGHCFRVPMRELTGREITIYGQQEVVKDLVASWLAQNGELRFEVEDVALQGLDGDRPRVTFRHQGEDRELACDIVAGCDGFHGVSRGAIPEGVLTTHEHTYPFGWLGILAHAAPAMDELVYAWHPHGFALYSMRSPEVVRLYLQVPAGEDPANWPDERIWAELQERLAGDGVAVNEGEIFDKAVTPMRSFVTEPMRFGRLFLAGDAAHIVPPTGAKGLNLAVNDVRLLAEALGPFFADGDERGLDAYSHRALRRVWRAQDFSTYMTQLLHNLGGGEFEQRLQRARLEYVQRSEHAACMLAENYVGLPAEDDF